MRKPGDAWAFGFHSWGPGRDEDANWVIALATKGPWC